MNILTMVVVPIAILVAFCLVFPWVLEIFGKYLDWVDSKFHR